MRKTFLLFLSCTMFISLSAQDKKSEITKKKSDVERMKDNPVKSTSFSDFNADEDGELFGIDVNADGQLQFIPNATDLSDTPIMTLDDDNYNVGIGTTTPQAALDVNGEIQMSSASIPMGFTTEVGGFSPLLNMDINFRHNNKNNTYLGAAFRMDSRTNSPLFQWMYRAPGIIDESSLMMLDVAGNLGIGTPATALPSEKLDVNGKIAITQSVNDEMVIINDDVWNHTSGDQDFGDGGDHFIMASNEGSGESGGIYGDGDLITLWAPGDGNGSASNAFLAVLDEDWFNAADTNPYNNTAIKWYLTESGGWIASDIERKENIKSYSNSLDKISALDVFTYNYKLAPAEVAKGQVNPEVVGIIAQDLNEVIPQAVNITPDGEHFINYNQVTPVLIGAVKELKTENETLKGENTVLKNELENMKAEIQAIKDAMNR